MSTITKSKPNLNAWEVFEDWFKVKDARPRTMSWAAYDELVEHYKRIIESKYETLLPLLYSWDAHLSDYGNDPTRYNWADFRPLRLSREEDWSDWLAHLLASSTTGNFASNLLIDNQVSTSGYANPIEVFREISHEGFRADVIVRWRDGNFSHIEVKIGDPSLYKTFTTSEALRNKFRVPAENWANYILLPSYQIDAWEQLSESNISTLVVAITWIDVCISLRRALLSREIITWKVWAYSLLGAIEQQIIGFPGYLLDKKRPSENLDEKIEILMRGLENEK